MTDHAKYKNTYRGKKRSNGYVLKQIWVKPEWWERVLNLLKKLDK